MELVKEGVCDSGKSRHIFNNNRLNHLNLISVDSIIDLECIEALSLIVDRKNKEWDIYQKWVKEGESILDDDKISYLQRKPDCRLIPILYQLAQMHSVYV